MTTPTVTHNWSDWNGESFLDLDTGFRVAPDGSLWPWQDTGNGYEIHVDAEGNPTVDPLTGKYRTRVLKEPADFSGGQYGLEPTPPVYGPGPSITAPKGAAGGRGGGGLTANQEATQARQQAQDQRRAALDERALQRQQEQDARNLEAEQKQFGLTSELGYAGSRRADVNTNLGRQGQAFSQEMALRKEAIDLAREPESYLQSAALRLGDQFPGGNALFDLLGSLGKRTTPGVEQFLDEQTALSELAPSRSPQYPFGREGQPAAAPPPAAAATPATAPGTATTAMYPAGYEAQNPNAQQQLQDWQAERVQAGQDPNDTEAFRQHLIGIGAPDFGVQAKAGEALGPMDLKPSKETAAVPVTPFTPGQTLPIGGVGATLTAPMKKATVMQGGPPLTPLQPAAQKSFPTLEELRGVPGLANTRFMEALKPLGTAPGTRYPGGISPFIPAIQGGVRGPSEQTLGALNPEDARALGQTLRYTGNRALLADMRRKPYGSTL